MEDNLLRETVLAKVKGDYSSLILFGSTSRGDNNVSSDIDIVQVSDVFQKKYSEEKINFSIYTYNKLEKMGRSGSLFILHLIREGQVIDGDRLIIKWLNRIFTPPVSYSEYRSELLHAAKLLDISQQEYSTKFKGYNALAFFLFRSYLYAYLYDNNAICFATKEVAKELNNPMIETALQIKKTGNDFKTFTIAKNLFELYAGERFVNQYKDSETLISETKKDHKLIGDLSYYISDTHENEYPID